MFNQSNIAIKLLFFIIIGSIFSKIKPAQAKETLAYNNYYSCGHYTIKQNNTSNNCNIFFPVSTAKSINQSVEFIFQSKIDYLEYHQASASDTGIADYLVSTILGVYFPTLETLNGNSGGSFFGGLKLKENMRLDAEIVGIFSGNSLEKTYFDLSTFLSLRFSVPISQQEGYPLLYFSPGIGISELEERYTKQEDEDTHPTWQLEAGIALPIHKSLGGYGGIKYIQQFNAEGDNFWGAESGITLKL